MQTATSPAQIDPAFSADKTAEILGLSERTIWTLIKDGKLRAVKLSARRTGIFLSEIQRYQQSLMAA